MIDVKSDITQAYIRPRRFSPASAVYLKKKVIIRIEKRRKKIGTEIPSVRTPHGVVRPALSETFC